MEDFAVTTENVSYCETCSFMIALVMDADTNAMSVIDDTFMTVLWTATVFYDKDFPTFQITEYGMLSVVFALSLY